ncbi:MAG TPA: ABC transporter permease [Bryobacteraceae bacterium]|jgi:predicted permease
MSVWTRIANVFRKESRLNREIDAELASHIDEAVDNGRNLAEAQRAFGSPLQIREASRDIRVAAWLDSLRADAIFGWRQLLKNKITSAAAILSLALAVGSCAAAFRLIDALLLRPMPVLHPEQLFALSRYGVGFNGKPSSFDGFAYPAFERMRAATKDKAELLAISYGDRYDLTYASDAEMEKAQIQYVSGAVFHSFGLSPAIGRLFNEDDDREPGAHPYAVLSNDYWTRRFGRDAGVIGRPFHMGDRVYEIIGVANAPFTGTEPGSFTDIFLPTMMHPWVTRTDSTWHSIIARVKPGVEVEPLRAQLNAISHTFEEERLALNKPPKWIADILLNQTLRLEPAPGGASDLRREYQSGLVALGILVMLVLLIACVNVANLMTAQAASRAREMALRVSIGAGRWRLIQLVLVEGAWISALAAAIGGVFAWWSAPFVVNMINPPDNPARLFLPWDWRVFGFSLALTIGVTLLFGLMPALRASAIQPASALKGGEDPHTRQRLMHVLIAAQVAFCVVVLFVSGLFAASFKRLSNRPMGFTSERLLNLETIASRPQPPVVWNQVADRLRSTPGIESVALAGWPVLAGGAENNTVSIDGAPPGHVLAFFLPVSPGWLATMKLPLIDGRDFRAEETSPGEAIVNETFVKQFFKNENPVGRSFERATRKYQIVGIARDAPYRDMREPILPVAYVLFEPALSRATFVVRTSTDKPLSLAAALRQEVRRARSDFRVSNIRTQVEINQSHTVRERLLAMLALFFAAVATFLGGIGLYGVLDYCVLQRRREIGIRMAIGSPASRIVRLVTVEALSAVVLGAAAGLALGIESARFIESLFYEVKSTDFEMVGIPLAVILAAALLASLPPVIHAVRIDPVVTLRSE